jgi:hypothetical protein
MVGASRISALLVVSTLAVGGRAGAANLIQNGGFDDDVNGWVNAFGSTIEQGPSDALGNPTSGSLIAAATTAGNTSIGALQCVPVVAGKTYVYGATARMSELQSGNAAFVLVDWYPQSNCTGGQIANTAALPYFMQLRGPWGPTQKWETAPPGAQSAFFWLRANAVSNNQGLFRAEFDNAFFLEDASCAATPTVLCLNDGRFRVIVDWLTKAGDDGFGQAVPLTGDSGYYWFFNAANVEMVAKLLDACPTAFDRFWFFAAGLTNVQVRIVVRDTQADVEKIYMNPLETPFAPIQDTDAFATCP